MSAKSPASEDLQYCVSGMYAEAFLQRQMAPTTLSSLLVISPCGERLKDTLITEHDKGPEAGMLRVVKVG